MFFISLFSYGQGRWNGNINSWSYDLRGERAILPEQMKANNWPANINTEHPRLFVNQNTLSSLRSYVVNKKNILFTQLVTEVDLLPDEAPFIVYESMVDELPTGEKVPKANSNGAGIAFFRYNGGAEAVKSALIYLINGEQKYLDKTKSYLRLFNKVLDWTSRNGKRMEHTGYSRINALVAYDWICNGLTFQEKEEILKPILQYINKAQRNGEFTFARTFGGFTDGNYGENSLVWYAGLAAYGEGVDDALANQFIKEGAALFIGMLNHREWTSAGTGILSASTVTYSFGDYPHSTFNFFHTWKSAFNEDLSLKWTQMLNYHNWFDWAKIKLTPGGKMLYHGIGDLSHADNLFSVPELYAHFAQVTHFYSGNNSEKTGNVYALMKELSDNGVRETIGGSKFPFLPYVLTGFDETKVNSSAYTPSTKPYFYSPNFGLLLMRSGNGVNDTYASFRFGASEGNHQHYDELSFIIYKKGFLALDAGSRTTTGHHHNFAAQSVAHNTLLIHHPNENMPYFWKPAGYIEDGVYFNHGGQYVKDKAKGLALQSNEDFTYAVGDATKNYSSVKSKEVVRQFLYLKPDIFVIYDRVVSVTEDQKKEFILHFQNEPYLSTSSAEWGSLNGGKLMVKTILPLNPKFNIVGGLGREFEASGRNWELPGGSNWDATMKLTGKWRVEVSDTNQRERTNFLHVIHASENLNGNLVKTNFNQTVGNNDILNLTDLDGNIWKLVYNRVGEIALTIEKRNKNNELLYITELLNNLR